MEAPTEQTSYLSYYNKVLPKESFVYLSKDEELDLISKAQNGDNKAVERLIMANYGFIIKAAKKRLNPGTTLEDLVEVGMVGFHDAIMKYNPEKETRLITLAHFQMLNAFDKDKDSNALVKGIDEKNLASLNTKVSSDSDSTELGDLITISNEDTPDAILERKEFKNYLRKSVDLFPERERRVAELAFGFVKPSKVQTKVNAQGITVERRITFESIGDELGITKQRAQQIFTNVKTMLRDENGPGRYVAGYIAA